MTENNN